MELVPTLPSNRPPTSEKKSAFPELASLARKREIVPTSPDRWCSESMKVNQYLMFSLR